MAMVHLLGLPYRPRMRPHPVLLLCSLKDSHLILQPHLICVPETSRHTPHHSWQPYHLKRRLGGALDAAASPCVCALGTSGGWQLMGDSYQLQLMWHDTAWCSRWG